MKFFRDNGLTIVLLLAALCTVAGMALTGQAVYNEELSEHSHQAVSMMSYLVSGHFLSALFENWESEFLQMSAYVMLTAFLFQRGSAESKDPDEPETDAIPDKPPRNAPAAIKMGGVPATLYSYSLGIALFALFILSFALHLKDSADAQSMEAALHGQPAVGLTDHLASAQLWFESFQNWQSEFLSTAVIVVLSIFLRFKGSPESKPVAAPHSETGA